MMTPNECLSEPIRWLLLRFLDLEQSCGKGSEGLVQPLRSGS